MQAASTVTRLWILLSRSQNPLLRPAVTINVKIKTKDGLLLYVGDAGNTSLVDAGTPLGVTAVVTPRECWLSTLGVLHPGVPAMWKAHIRDLSPSAEAVREAVCPM